MELELFRHRTDSFDFVLQEFVDRPGSWTPTKVPQIPIRAVQKQGWAKLKSCTEQVKKFGFQWLWIDTCCIDKRSSSELSESINSMFNWYVILPSGRERRRQFFRFLLTDPSGMTGTETPGYASLTFPMYGTPRSMAKSNCHPLSIRVSATRLGSREDGHSRS